MSKSSDEARSAARQLYCDTRMQISEIVRQTGVSRSSVRRWAKKGRWRRPGEAPSETGESAQGRPAFGAGDDIDLLAVQVRVGRVMEWVVAQLEDKMNAGDKLNPAEMERSVRAIASLARSIEKFSDLKSERDQADREAHGGNEYQEEAERLRLALAERLLKLRDQHIGAGGHEILRGAERSADPEAPR